MKPKARRVRLVEKGGVEMHEIRIVRWFDTTGRVWTSVETSTPDGPTSIDLHEALVALRAAETVLIDSAEEE